MEIATIQSYLDTGGGGGVVGEVVRDADSGSGQSMKALKILALIRMQ
jgi:hypothetical protein